MTHLNKIITITLIAIAVLSKGNTQQIIGTQNSISNQARDLQYTIKNNSDIIKNAKGSPFIDKTFKPIKFKKFDNKIYSARFDAHLQEMQIRLDNDTIVLNNSEDYTLTFTSGNKTYKTYSYTENNSITKRGFLVVLKETDSIALLKQEIIKFRDAKPANSAYEKEKPAEFRRASDIYYYRLGNKTSLLPQKRKNFLKLFPEHATELKEFLKKNKINLKRDDDLITLFEFIETL